MASDSCVSLTEVKVDDPSKHAKIIMSRISGPYSGCVYEWQFLLLKWDEDREKYRLAQRSWDGWHKNLVGDFGHEDYDVVWEDEIVAVLEEHGFPSYINYLDEKDLYSEIQATFIVGMVRLSEMFPDVEPFTWECFECETRQEEEPAWWGSMRGDGGIGMTYDKPLCEDCAPPPDERYF